MSNTFLNFCNLCPTYTCTLTPNLKIMARIFQPELARPRRAGFGGFNLGLIMDAYKQYVYDTYGIKLKIKSNEVDNSGKFIFGKGNTKADYLVNGKLLEIKFNNRLLSFFQFKACQLDSYIKQNAHVLFVNGYETNCPVFTIMSINHLKKPIYFKK